MKTVKLFGIYRKFLRLKSLLSTIIIAGFSAVAFGQVFPSFPIPPTQGSSASPLRGISMASMRSDSYPNLLYAFYSDPNGRLAYAYSTDGTNFSGEVVPGNGAGGFYAIAQTTTYGENTAAVGVAASNADTAFIGYVEAGTNQLVVLQASTIPGVSYGLAFQEVYRDTNPGVVITAPGIAYDASSGNIVMVYGTNRSQNNEGWTTYRSNGVWHSEDANLYSPTQPGLAWFHGNLYMVAKQNNGDNNNFIDNLDSTGHLLPGEFRQITGSTDRGYSMLVWNGQLTFAARKNGGNFALVVYVSSDAQNWYSHEYDGDNSGSTPGLVLFGGGITTAFKSGISSQYVLYAAHSN